MVCPETPPLARENALRQQKDSPFSPCTPQLGVALMNASVFTSYKYAMNLLLSSSPEATEPTLAQITAAGSASGVFTSLRPSSSSFDFPLLTLSLSAHAYALLQYL